MVLEAIVDYTFQPQDVFILLALILLEGVLSFDNAAVLAAMVRRLPPPQRKRALLYGLVGAYVFRVAAILLAVVIINNPFLRVIGGGYLVFLGVKHFAVRHADQKGHTLPKVGMLGLSVFWSTVVSIELADIAFALDQVVAAVAFTEKVPLIIVAAMIAIVLLRLAAVYMARLMDWFPALEHIAYLVVALVGVKLVVEQYPGIHIDETVSAPVTMAFFLGPILYKLARDRMGRRGAATTGPASPSRYERIVRALQSGADLPGVAAGEAPLRLIVVDDDPTSRRLVKGMLEAERQRCVVDEAPGVAEAADMMQKSRYDCIILDQLMPDVSGVEFLTILGKTGYRAPVVMVTGSGGDDDAKAAMAAGASDVLRKESLTRERLMGAVEAAVGRSRGA